MRAAISAASGTDPREDGDISASRFHVNPWDYECNGLPAQPAPAQVRFAEQWSSRAQEHLGQRQGRVEYAGQERWREADSDGYQGYLAEERGRFGAGGFARQRRCASEGDDADTRSTSVGEWSAGTRHRRAREWGTDEWSMQGDEGTYSRGSRDGQSRSSAGGSRAMTRGGRRGAYDARRRVGRQRGPYSKARDSRRLESMSWISCEQEEVDCRWFGALVKEAGEEHR